MEIGTRYMGPHWASLYVGLQPSLLVLRSHACTKSERSTPDETSLTLPTPSQLTLRNPYTSTSLLALRAITQHTTLRELHLVREWLHDTAPAPPSSLTTTAGGQYRALTKHRVVHARRGAGAGGGFVKELDPDAEYRGGGVLDADDSSTEKALSRALLALVRAGKLDEARQQCRTAGHDWRAAMIGGATTFRWDAVGTFAALSFD